MKTIATNANNDIYLNSSNSLAIDSDLQAVLNVCEKTVQTMLNELVLFGNIGMPNFNTIWNGSPNVQQFENALRNAITQIPKVISIEEINIFAENNTLRYNMTIKTEFGTGAINGV